VVSDADSDENNKEVDADLPLKKKVKVTPKSEQDICLKDFTFPIENSRIGCKK